MEVKKFNFCQSFLLGFVLKFLFALDVGPLWHSKHVFRHFSHVRALFITCVQCVHTKCLIKCLYDIFSLFWTPMSTKLWGCSCFLIRIMFGLLVVYFTHLAPHVHFSCIVYALHIVTSCSHLCYPCHALVYILFPHSYHVMFTLCFIALCF